ncbi:hypothetical protein [Sphingomonas sp. IC4-52]|uniref:hypothetical protein n=1 Tax=Sphingomonas sp. IC4-52 TaxID=2887202 RepID=UPI001D114814|nr:hypothetical protein [Sphingomonas sp. IC4-52]MCC2979218.1 hypothetical protein [Sphingomonas sp. IC4-52]
MAYMAFDTLAASLPPSGAACLRVEPITTAADQANAGTSPLSALEWSVVALARNDSLSSLRQPGRLSMAMATIFRQSNPRLADPKLEALRRMAVLAWHHSFQVPASELRAFFEAGFTVGHYETMMASISASLTRDRGGRRGR